MLRSLPEGGLSPLGITMDTSIARKEAFLLVGGRIAHFIDNWEKISSDPWVREAVCGHKLELRATPRQLCRPRLGEMDTTKAQILTKEVDNLVAKGAVTECVDDGGGFVSPLFLVPKSDGSWRPVINLRDLNLYVAASHFKMESVRTVKTIIQRDDWMLKLNLKDAYLSVPIHRAHQKYLRFWLGGRLWQFKVLPFGLSSAPQTFTKLMKPVVSTLRKLGFRLILYLDDMLMMAHSKEEARKGLAAAMELLCSLGFIINVKKSVFTPARTIAFLGFSLDSASMTISLPQHKLKEIRRSAGQLLRQQSMPARQLARLLGMIVAAHPAVLPAPLHSRFLERAKRRAVQGQRGYDAMVRLESNAAQDLQWWVDSAANFNGRPLQIPKWDRVIESDASLRGWGASSQGRSTGGPWTVDERRHHINYLELLAAFLALKSFAGGQHGISILLLLDNVTEIAFLNRMGGTHSIPLSDLAVEIWNWCINQRITIHAEHLPGVENVRADWESRHLTDSSDWMLQREVFAQLQDMVGPFSIDLFASRTNAQLPMYCSWRPDPHALAVDAFSIPWRDHRPYLFPPFVLIPRCLSRITKEGITAVLIAPVWPNQVWFPQLLANLVTLPVLFPPMQDIVSSPGGQRHPLAVEGRLSLAALFVSGDPARHRAFRSELQTSSENHGGHRQSQPTAMYGDSGLAGAWNGRQIRFQPL